MSKETIDTIRECIYNYVIHPLSTDSFQPLISNHDEPITYSLKGQKAFIFLGRRYVNRSDVRGHNYERDIAMEARDLAILLNVGGGSSIKISVAADCNRRKNTITLYYKAFNKLKNGGIILNMLEKMLMANGSYYNVKIDHESNRESFEGTVFETQYGNKRI